jgi:thiamine-phosphate pyrophosphorylase
VSHAALADVRLIAITDRAAASAATTLSRVERLVKRARPRSVVVQLRDRELGARERLQFGSELGALARAHRQLFQVNDRLDLAVVLDADGVHLGEASVTTHDARALLGAERFVTRACHDAERAAELDADAILLSPVFAPRKAAAALGAQSLARARQLLCEGTRPARLFALGGVDATNAASCLTAGADGAAAIGATVGNDAPEALLAALGILV